MYALYIEINRKRFSLGKEQNKYYQDMLQNIKDNINEWSKFEFTAKLMKLREIVSGFVINKDGTITDFDTSKNKVLEDCFEEVGDYLFSNVRMQVEI